MRRRLLLLTSAAALVAALAAPAGASAASTGPCLPGAGSPICHFWMATVTAINDGDTIEARIDGETQSHLIRFTGINAMELHRYSEYANRRRGECHGVQAADRLEQLLRLGGMRVRLAAQDASSHSGHRDRLRRQVSVRIRGRWVDVNRTLLAEGRVLWLPNGKEYAWNREYSALAEQARARGRNLWDPSFCGETAARSTAAAPAPRMWVKSDADGPDTSNVNGEWVRIVNPDPTAALPIGGWWVRDATLERYTFPAGASIPPGGAVTLHVGTGTSGNGVFYWGQSQPVFENATSDGRAMGDGAYLFDPAGNLRASFVYPCRTGSCTDPLQGALALAAEPRRDEYVTITNVSGAPVDLYGHQLQAVQRFYDFAPGTIIGPGQTLRLDMGGSPALDTPLQRHWGLPMDVLGNHRGAVSINNYQGTIVACASWGGETC